MNDKRSEDKKINQNQIKEWQEKLQSTFGEESNLYDYLFSTMDNFYYRYLETSTEKDLFTKQFDTHLWGARSEEKSILMALKITNPVAKKGIIELAKSYPKGEGVSVRYELTGDVRKLNRESGEIHFTSTIDWGFPDFRDEEKRAIKKVIFQYSSLGEFRKELARKLESACEHFL